MSKNDRNHEISKFAARIEDESISREQLAAEFRALENLLRPQSKPPGRPPGAKTKAATSGVKIARAFFYCEAFGYSPTASAKIVSEMYGRDESTVFASIKRHAIRVIEEVGAYLVHSNPLDGSGFATTHPDAFELIVATITEFQSDPKGGAGAKAREVARISMSMVRLIVMEDNKNKL